MAWIAANLPMIICMLVGLVLLIIEAFIPGFGVAGLTGICFEIAGVVLVYMGYGPVPAVIALLIALAVAGLVLFFSLRSARKGKLSQSDMVLKDVQRDEDGYRASDDLSRFGGKSGTVQTELRPTGMALIDGERLNVRSDGSFIEVGANVCGTRVDGNRVLVRRAE